MTVCETAFVQGRIAVRALTLWTKLLAAGLLLASAQCAFAGPFFLDCEEAFKKPEFSLFKAYLGRNMSDPQPGLCFRLNNREFLATVNDIGRRAQGLYYYDARTNDYRILDGFRPNVAIEREFTGANKKRYVLLSWSNLSAGDWDTGYEILQLVPAKGGRPYALTPLLKTNEDPEVGMCGEWSGTDTDGNNKSYRKKTDGVASKVEGYEIRQEGTAKVAVTFQVTAQDCSTLKKSTTARMFLLKNGHFSEMR